MDLSILTTLWDAGSRAWDFYKRRGACFNNDEFLAEYFRGLRGAIDAVAVIQAMSPEQLDEGAHEILGIIASVVRGYNQDGDVNASCMLLEAPTDDLVKRAMFAMHDRTPDSFAGFLVLDRWATPVNGLPKPLEFILPIEHSNGERCSEVLFGAPKAFVDRRPDIITDTLDMGRHLQNITQPTIRRAVETYFREQAGRLRSFTSLPVVLPKRVKDKTGQATAVVNIQSSEPGLLGGNVGNNRKLFTALEPFLQVLAHILSQQGKAKVLKPVSVGGAA